MRILHAKSGKYHKVNIELVKDQDWKKINDSKQFSFNWSKEKKQVVYQLKLDKEGRIMGLIAIQDIPKESRIHIHLIENSKSNIGKNKEYRFVAGCLLASICKLSFEKGYEGFVSLKAKTSLLEHYKVNYGFKSMGRNLFIFQENAMKLIKQYL